MTINIILILVWIAYMILEGDRESFLYSYASHTTKPLNINLHSLFTVQRTLAFSAFVLSLVFNIHLWLPVALISLGLIAVSPFFHDGMYYYMRNVIDGIYPKKWLDNDVDITTNSSLMDKLGLTSTPARIIYLVIGIVLIVLAFVI